MYRPDHDGGGASLRRVSSVRRWLEARSPRLRAKIRALKPSYRRRVGALNGLSTAEVFDQYYEQNHWSAGESVSGGGSGLDATASLRHSLPALLFDLGTRSLLDVPCGDHHWMATVDLGEIGYTGGDIVQNLVDATRARFGGPRRAFHQIDLISDSLPAADVLLVRDCLIHLNHESIWSVLRNVGQSGIGSLLVSHYPDLKANIDSPIGPATPVSLTLPPFSLPAPDRQLEDGGSGNQPKTLALWSVDTIRRACWPDRADP
jgi:hypothetical protein